MVHCALARGVGARRAVEVNLAFHGPSRRLDPAEAAVTDAVASWARWVPGWAGSVEALGEAWTREWGRPTARWQGPLAAVQADIRRLGWIAQGPMEWTGSRCRWPTSRRLAKRGRGRQAGLLRCVLAGGAWPQARLAAAGLAESANCPRCGLELETVVFAPVVEVPGAGHGPPPVVLRGAACDFQPRRFRQKLDVAVGGGGGGHFRADAAQGCGALGPPARSGRGRGGGLD